MANVSTASQMLEAVRDWCISKFTKVVANPTGTASGDLTKIQIGSDVLNIAGGGTGEVVEMTYAEYQALTPQQKMDGTVRYITDYPSGGGGAGAGYIKELVYDSGSTTVGAPYNVDIPFIKSIAEYDQLLIITAAERDGGIAQRINATQVLIDISKLDDAGYYCVYFARTLRMVSVTNTTFNYYGQSSGSGDNLNTPSIFKIYGIKFGGGSLPDYSTTEHKTGQKWIDGKDIYCIVIADQHVQHAANQFWEYDLTSLNIDEYLWCFARCGKNSNAPQIVFPWVTDYHDNNEGIKYGENKFGIRGKTSGDYTNVNIILWYTKN